MQEHVQVEASKCKACHRCEIACIAAHHDLDFKTAMKQKDKYAPRGWAIKGDNFKTSVRCHGCNPAPCCNICPTGALAQHKDGTFEIHLELCAGCMMCMSVCPYGCVSFETEEQQHILALAGQNLPPLPPRQIAVRCDLCADWRAEKGVEYTACMEACMTRALTYLKPDGRIIEAPAPAKKESAKPKVAEKPAAEGEKKKSE
ncbi:MAG: 4Fe-4S binding protein [Desulfovibrionaceae bacterium]|nr:4Fe-4S binding protein [Desulfovibrionaceae bacterium]